MTTTPETPADREHASGDARWCGQTQGAECARAMGADCVVAAVRRGGLHRALRGRHEQRLYITVDDELEVDHHRGPEVDDPIEEIRAVLHRSERQELASRQLSGLSPARIALLAPVDRSERDAITHGSAEHGDGIDLGW